MVRRLLSPAWVALAGALASHDARRAAWVLALVAAGRLVGSVTRAAVPPPATWDGRVHHRCVLLGWLLVATGGAAGALPPGGVALALGRACVDAAARGQWRGTRPDS